MSRSVALAVLVVLAGSAVAAADADADAILERYAEARGGRERWAEVKTLRATGAYSAFSFKEPCTLIRSRGDRYRLDFDMLQAPAVRARDAAGTWGLHKLLWPEPARVDGSPYQRQFEREAVFGPLLLEAAERGLELESLGAGEIDGIPTVGLRVTWPDGLEETWHLDAETYLEVAVDYDVVDFTQARDPVLQRTFFDDFRPVDGLVLPHWLEHQFNHRLENLTIERWEVNPQLADDAFSGPPVADETATDGDD